MIRNSKTGEAIGSTRFYDFNETNKIVLIGYTFLARSHWGGTYNPALKSLMLDHAFNFVDTVLFHVGVDNTRSQKAMEKSGAAKVEEIEVAYYGEPVRSNFVYKIDRQMWKGTA